jgi:hypothetical protein
MTCVGLSKDRYNELLGSLLRCLFKNFRACSRPESYLVRADETHNLSESHGKKVMLVGASNLGQSLPHFSAPNLELVGVTVPGWTPCPENVKKMVSIVEDVAFVFDLFGNSSVRFQQFYGTTALPFKSNSKFHLAGKFVVTPPDIFRKVVENITPILKAKGNKPLSAFLIVNALNR